MPDLNNISGMGIIPLWAFFDRWSGMWWSMTMLRGKVTACPLSVEIISGVRSQGSSRWSSIVDVVVGLWIGQARNHVPIPSNGKKLFYLQSFWISSGAHTASCSMCSGNCFWERMWPVRNGDLWLPYSC
jgi:hypothetical protein